MNPSEMNDEACGASLPLMSLPPQRTKGNRVPPHSHIFRITHISAIPENTCAATQQEGWSNFHPGPCWQIRCVWIEESQLVAVWLMKHNISHWSRNNTENSLNSQRIFMSFHHGEDGATSEKRIKKQRQFWNKGRTLSRVPEEFCSKRGLGVCQSSCEDNKYVSGDKSKSQK